MKLFNTENGKETVYVQMQDIMYLNQSDMPIPASIYTKVFTGITIVNDSNRFDFVSFNEEHEVKFFRELEFVIDYDQYKDLTDEQLEEEGYKLATKANEVAAKWKSMSSDERKKNSNLLQEHENIGYMLNFLSEIYAVKHGKRYMPFPTFVKLPERSKKKCFFRRKKMWNEERSSAFMQGFFQITFRLTLKVINFVSKVFKNIHYWYKISDKIKIIQQILKKMWNKVNKND